MQLEPTKVATDGRGLARPRSVAEARRQIEETRGQISDTIGTIEAELEAKKRELKARLDVPSMLRERIRRNPWPALGVALAAGALISLALGLRRGLSGQDRRLLSAWLRTQADALED